MKKTTAEWQAIRIAIESDPANLNQPGTSLFIYTEKARKKLDKIAREITNNMAEARKTAGNPVPCDGYSGRQSNRK